MQEREAFRDERHAGEQELVAAREEIDSLQESLDALAEELHGREEQLAGRAEELLAELRRLDERQKDLDERQAALASQEEALAERAASLDRQAADVKASEADVAAGKAEWDLGGVASQEELWAVFEYLAVRCKAGRWLVCLAEALAVRAAALADRERFAVQCRLAEALGQREGWRFFLALYLAGRVAVPQARGLLLEMLTRRDLVWTVGSGSGATTAGTGDRRLGIGDNDGGGDAGGDGLGSVIDLRPLVVGALGRLRDRSLNGVFRRLREKVSGLAGNEAILAAVDDALAEMGTDDETGTYRKSNDT